MNFRDFIWVFFMLGVIALLKLLECVGSIVKRLEGEEDD
jgi:hypothetical protein